MHTSPNQLSLNNGLVCQTFGAETYSFKEVVSIDEFLTFDWANSKGNRQCKNWFYHVKHMLVKIDLPNYTDINTLYPKRKMAQDVAEKLMINRISDWFDTFASQALKRNIYKHVIYAKNLELRYLTLH